MAKSASPFGPAFTSSGVIGVRSGPGSTTMPVMRGAGHDAVLTVVKVSVRSLPGVPVPAASSSDAVRAFDLVALARAA